jgi:hypothetical protein
MEDWYIKEGRDYYIRQQVGLYTTYNTSLHYILRPTGRIPAAARDCKSATDAWKPAL